MIPHSPSPFNSKSINNIIPPPFRSPVRLHEAHRPKVKLSRKLLPFDRACDLTVAHCTSGCSYRWHVMFARSMHIPSPLATLVNSTALLERVLERQGFPREHGFRAAGFTRTEDWKGGGVNDLEVRELGEHVIKLIFRLPFLLAVYT